MDHYVNGRILSKFSMRWDKLKLKCVVRQREGDKIPSIVVLGMIENFDAQVKEYSRRYSPVPSSYRKKISERIRTDFMYALKNSNPEASRLAGHVLESDIYFVNTEIEPTGSEKLIRSQPGRRSSVPLLDQ